MWPNYSSNPPKGRNAVNKANLGFIVMNSSFVGALRNFGILGFLNPWHVLGLPFDQSMLVVIIVKFEGWVCRALANWGFVGASLSLAEAWKNIVISCSLNPRGCSF